MVFPVVEQLRDGSYLSAIYEETNQRRNKVDPVPVRVVGCTVSNGAQISEFRLLTTLLEPNAVIVQELTEAYAKR